MQGHAVAFAIEHDGAMSVGSNRVAGDKDLAAVGLDRGDGFVKPAFRVQI